MPYYILSLNLVSKSPLGNEYHMQSIFDRKISNDFWIKAYSTKSVSRAMVLKMSPYVGTCEKTIILWLKWK